MEAVAAPVHPLFDTNEHTGNLKTPDSVKEMLKQLPEGQFWMIAKLTPDGEDVLLLVNITHGRYKTNYCSEMKILVRSSDEKGRKIMIPWHSKTFEIGIPCITPNGLELVEGLFKNLRFARRDELEMAYED